MPSSRCNHIPIVLGVVQQLAPRSILDVGVGFGKWGHLFREYTDIRLSERDPARYQRENWQVRIDGIEGHAPYLTPAHAFFYNHIFVGDMRTQIDAVDTYDLVFLGDVLEHVAHDDGQTLLRACLAHATRAVLVTTPARETHQADACANPLEIHRSVWQAADFSALAPAVTHIDENETLLAVLLKPGTPRPTLAPPRRRAVRARPALWQRLCGVQG
jgi:hypothetical protein